MISFFRKLNWLSRRRRKESDLLEEIKFHLDEETEEQVSNGLTTEEARRATRLQFGRPVSVQEDVRATWSWIGLEQFWQDLSYAARSLRRSPLFTMGAVAVLALGMGANLALFQIFDATIVHRYSIPAAETFVRFSRVSRDGVSRTFPSAAVEFYSANSSSFASLISEDTSFAVVVDGMPGRPSTFISDNYFDSVAIHPERGRLFDQQDARLGAPPVALLGHQYWHAQFGADPQVVGRIIHVNDAAVQIVGVLPDDFNGFSLQQTDLWFPLNSRRLLIPGSPTGQSEFFGTLKAGSSAASGAAELTALTRELARQQPRFIGEDDRIQADLVQESLLHFFLTRSPVISIFAGMVLLVLLSACAHLGNMLLVRGLARQHEFAVRTAIGASRSRLTRQLVTENILLAVIGSAAGLAVGVIAARLLLIYGDISTRFDVSLHWQTIVACVSMTFISVFAFGLPSARETTRPGFQTSSLRSRFLSHQVSVSCVLLVITGAFASKGMLDGSLDLMFDYRNIVVVDPQLYAREGQLDVLQLRVDTLSARLTELPGVESIAVATAVPLRGRVVDNFPRFPRVHRSAVAPEFFDVIGLSIVHGRNFLPGEQDAVIASESAARSLWPNQDPLGQLWDVAGAKRSVVGIVQDSVPSDLIPGTVEAYLPLSTRDIERSLLVLHTRGDPAAIVAMIPDAASELGESVSVTQMSTIRDSVLEARLLSPAARLFGSVGLIATALAAFGLFALMAFTVVQRRREIGIRIAVGATPLRILLELSRSQVKPMVPGVGRGTIIGVILLLLIRLPMEIQASNVVFVGGVVLGLITFALVAALAILIPALRALRIDLPNALRAQ